MSREEWISKSDMPAVGANHWDAKIAAGARHDVVDSETKLLWVPKDSLLSTEPPLAIVRSNLPVLQQSSLDALVQQFRRRLITLRLQELKEQKVNTVSPLITMHAYQLVFFGH